MGLGLGWRPTWADLALWAVDISVCLCVEGRGRERHSGGGFKFFFALPSFP